MVSDLLKCEVTRAPNFQKVIQISEEFYNKNIPVMFTASTSNRGLQGGFDFFFYFFDLMTFATYKIDSDFSVKNFRLLTFDSR